MYLVLKAYWERLIPRGPESFVFSCTWNCPVVKQLGYDKLMSINNVKYLMR